MWSVQGSVLQLRYSDRLQVVQAQRIIQDYHKFHQHEIRHQKHELFKTAILDSAVDFNQIEEVFVIVPTKSDSHLFID